MFVNPLGGSALDDGPNCLRNGVGPARCYWKSCDDRPGMSTQLWTRRGAIAIQYFGDKTRDLRKPPWL